MGFFSDWKQRREQKRKELEQKEKQLEFERRRQRRFPTIDFRPMENCVQWQCNVVGESFHKKEISSIGVPNKTYKLSKSDLYKNGLLDVQVYEFWFPKVETVLLPEPSNKHDKNAVRVYMNGVQVGYIKANESASVNKMLEDRRIRRIQGYLSGGNSRTLNTGGCYYEDGEKIPLSELYIDRESGDYSATVFIDFIPKETT